MMSKHPIRLSLLCVLFLFSCSLLSCNQAVPQQKLDPVESWIKQHAVPFKTAEPGTSDADLGPLKQLVGNASIVGLGEETHGTHEFFAMKARITEYLVQKMGFSIFALENSWSSSRLIDSYVTTGVGDPKTLLSNDMYPTWDRQEFLDLITWMRTYNANPAHTTKVHFAGVDCTILDQTSFSDVQAYVQAVDPPQVSALQTLYSGLDQQGSSFAARGVPPETFAHYDKNAQKVYDLLQARQAAYVSRSSQQAFDLALQTARVIVQYATLQAQGWAFNSLALYPQRDAYMAENARWIYNHAGSNARMVLSAHNIHIANDLSYRFGSTPDVKNMGGLLRERFKSAYLPIGMSFYQGSFLAFESGNGALNTFTIGAPDPTSSNYPLGQVGLVQYFLDLRHLPIGEVKDWAYAPKRFRVISQVYDPSLEASDYTEGSLQQWFDVIIHFQNTTAAHLVQ